MSKETGIAVLEENEHLYKLWINGSTIKAMLPVLEKYFKITKDTFFPTILHYVMQQLNPYVGMTFTLKGPDEYWDYYVEQERDIPLVFGYNDIPERFNRMILAENSIYSQAPTLLWLYWLMSYFVVRKPADYVMDGFDNIPFKRYITEVKPDMKILHEFLQEHEQNGSLKYPTFNHDTFPHKPITISTGHETLTLENKNNWFWYHLREYLKEYYVEYDDVVVQQEVNDAPKKGAPTKMFENTVTMQLFRFFKGHSNLGQLKVKIPARICDLITMFFHIITKVEIISEEEKIFIEEKIRLAGKDREMLTYWKKVSERHKTKFEWRKIIRDRISKYYDMPEEDYLDWDPPINLWLGKKSVKYW